MVAVFFHVLKLAEIAPCLRTCRVKNKFLDKRLPTHIQTNVLMNLLLLYPSTAEEFAESGMFGEFDESMAGKCLMVCELQITMKDFLQIKRLQHCYYDLTRVKRDDLAAFLLSSGPFIDPNTLKEKVPSVVKQMEEQSSRLSVAMPNGGASGVSIDSIEVDVLRQQLAEKDRQLARKASGSAPYKSPKGLPSKMNGADLVGKRLFIEGYGEGTVVEFRKKSMGASSHVVRIADASAADGTRTEVLVLHHFRLGAATGVRYVVLS